ncbi:hypothetical protein MKX08_010582 [Trichoderma sp. CBMAI-0020]|nr:hypothetical protein MKX08_010582 [Trichoderma sp. CBMAI-0020]
MSQPIAHWFLGTWEVRWSQMAGQGIRSFGDRRDMLCVRHCISTQDTYIWRRQGQQLADTDSEPPLRRFASARSATLGFDGRQTLQPHRGLADLPGNSRSCICCPRRSAMFSTSACSNSYIPPAL